MAEIISAGVHRPRNVDWKRAAALLYGDWGTSKAYVLGLAFVAAGFASGPIILAVCVLTAVVGFNYLIVCAHFPDGGGVYSAARQQSRFLASVGALLLIANFLVTAALSGWAGVSYFGVPTKYAPEATMAVILALGILNYFGPKHSGSVSIWLAVPAVIVVAISLEIDHRIDDMLESFGPGDGAFLSNVPCKENRCRRRFGEHHQLSCNLANLRNAARCRLDLFAEYSLDGIDDDEVRPEIVCLGDDRLQVGFTEKKKILGIDTQPLAAHLDLPLRFFAGNIENLCARGS